MPQGSVLGPLLLSLYVRHVPEAFKHRLKLQYADDISFFSTGRNTFAIVSKLQADLDSLDSHLDEIGLKLNPAKTQFMVISKPNVSDDFSDCVLTCKGEHIELVQHAKYLGIFIDEHLHFHHQVKYVVDSALRKAGTFKHGRRNLTTTARQTFYLSVCQATLDYASNAYVHCLSNNLHTGGFSLVHNLWDLAFLMYSRELCTKRNHASYPGNTLPCTIYLAIHRFSR